MEPAAINPDSVNSRDDFFRTILLSVASVAIGTLLLKTIIAPTVSKPDLSTFIFPENVPLKSWQMTASKSTEVSAFPTNGPAGEIVNAQQYRYRLSATNSSDSLLVNAYYLTGTDGDLKPFILAKTSQVGTATKRDSTGGFYAVFSDQGQAHVTSCLNSRGPSTVTSDQFSRNRLIYDTRLSRLLPWLQGKQTLPDERCVWTQLSVPLNQYASDAMAYEAVEAAWFDWADEWRF